MSSLHAGSTDVHADVETVNRVRGLRCQCRFELRSYVLFEHDEYGEGVATRDSKG